MGWTWTRKRNGQSVKQFFTEQWPDIEILECGVVNLKVAYMACRYKKESAPQDVWAAIILLGYDKTDYRYNFGYKDMDETMGPVYYDCPERVLDALSPVPDRLSDHSKQYAIEWRERCRERIKTRHRIALTKGKIICFPEPVKFSNGEYESRFEIVNGKRLVARGITTNTLYKLSKRLVQKASEM